MKYYSLIVTVSLASLAACGTGGSAGTSATQPASAKQNLQADGAKAAAAAANPNFQGVYFANSGRMYLSSEPLSCDSSVLKPGQTLLYALFDQIAANTTYDQVDLFYTSPNKRGSPHVELSTGGFDASCTESPFAKVTATACGSFPQSDGLHLGDIDATTGEIKGQLAKGVHYDPNSTVDPTAFKGASDDFTAVADFTVTACPTDKADPFAATPPDPHCVFADECRPVTVSCQQP